MLYQSSCTITTYFLIKWTFLITQPCVVVFMYGIVFMFFLHNNINTQLHTMHSVHRLPVHTYIHYIHTVHTSYFQSFSLSLNNPSLHLVTCLRVIFCNIFDHPLDMNLQYRHIVRFKKCTCACMQSIASSNANKNALDFSQSIPELQR